MDKQESEKALARKTDPPQSPKKSATSKAPKPDTAEGKLDTVEEGLVSSGTGAKSAQDTDTPASKEKLAPSNLEATQDFEAGTTRAPREKTASPASGNLGKVATLGNYQLLKKIGQGGMGTVFKARHLQQNKQVAVKVLSRDLANNTTFVQRFHREAKVMASLNHPNVLRAYEAGQAQGYHYLAMEYVEGGSVEGWLKKLNQFSLGDGLHIILACARALEHAHGLGMVHRDIKPDNILLTAQGEVKVADMGLAKAQDDDLGLTKTGTGAGTPLYMAPEQARNVKYVDGRSDIFSLGCMLYRFLAGQFPFQGDTLVEIIEAKEKGVITPLRRHNQEVPPRLELIVDKMLASKPEHRFATCTEVIKELEAFQAASESLSFFVSAVPEPAAPPEKEKRAAPGMKPVRPAAPAQSTQVPVKAKAPTAAKDETVYWYVRFTNPQGKAITKKVTAAELLTLIKSHSIDEEAEVSQDLKGSYRAVGAYKEFQAAVKAAATTEQARRSKDKFKNLYSQFDADARKRKIVRFLKGLVNKAGSWLILALILVIIFFMYKYGIQFISGSIEEMKKN